jgi:hypothetical protein
MPRFALALFAASALFCAQPLTALAQDDTSGEDAMLVRLNELRAAQGLSPLVRDEHLDAAARRHSHDMADHDQLMHVSETTGTPTDRVHAAGVATDEIAENVAMHHDTAQAEATLEASAPHLANILNPRFTHVGLASILDGDGTYVTQVFGRIEAGAPVAPSAPEIIPPAVDASPTVAVPSFALPDATPSITVETPVAPPTPSTLGQAVVVPPSSSGVVTVPPARPGVAGYWVCGSGRWWYYPIPAGAAGGSQLQPDLSISGPPPGYAPSCGGSTYAVAPRYTPPPPVYRPAPSYPAPSYPPSYSPPPPRYGAPGPVVVTPGLVIGPWGGGVRVEVAPAPMYAPAPVYVTPPRVYGRRGRRGWRR